MPDVTIAYKNSTIASIAGPGAISLSTAGRYCEDDITVTYAPNFEDITISQDYLAKQNTVISNGIIFQTDETYPGTPVVIDNATFANIDNGNLGQYGIGIKIELNRTYHCTGELKIEWSTGEQEIYSIDSDFTPTNYSVNNLSFSWEGIGISTQTFNYVYLNFVSSSANGYKIFMRPTTGGSTKITKSGVLLDGSYYQISITSNGFNTINLNLSEDPRFQAIYKSLAYRSIIDSSAPGVSEWCDSLSKTTSQQFAGQLFSGNFVFNNISFIQSKTFGSVHVNATTGLGFYWNCSFPSCTRIENEAFFRNNAIMEAYFPRCSYIGEYGFVGCARLTTISFPQCSYIGNYAFQGCQSLKTIDFPSCTTIGAYAFSICYSLSNINFPNCTSIGNYAFQSCTKLTSISFPNCTTIGMYAFNSCSALAATNFPNCTSIGNYAFQCCSVLTMASFPSCTTIGAYAFSSCYSLSSINFPKCTSIGANAFNTCSALTVVSLPNCTYLNQYVFRSCINLSSFYFMGSSIPSITNYTFNYTTLSFSSYLGYFGSIYVPASLLASYKTAQYWSQYSSRMVGI